MPRVKLILIFIIMFLFMGCSVGANSTREAVFLTNCRVIDGTGAPPLDNAVVAINGSVITKVGTDDSISIPEGANVIDLKGAAVMPGIINAHVHQAYETQNLENWLMCGVTTVRDESPPGTGDYLSKKNGLNKDIAHRSRIISATPMLAPVGGYGNAYYTSADDAVKKVNEYIDQGADIVKFSIEDDLQGSTWKLPTYEEVKAIVDAAHARGCKVSVHLSHERNLKMAIDAGVDDIAHMVVEPISEATAKQIIEKGIYWVPTLELWSYVSKDYSLDWIDVAIENLSLFYKVGGKIALGTDFAGYASSFEYFPDAEVKLMRQAGMTPTDVVVAATKNAAYVCGQNDALGTIEAGKTADLLIVIGDPLSEDPQLSLRMVIHAGEIAVDNDPSATDVKE